MNYLLEVCLAVTFATGITPSIGAQSQAVATQAMQEGISVQLAVTSNAVPMPDADRPDALIVAVTDDGTVYLGVNSISPAALSDKIKFSLFNRPEKKLYVKVDARTPYAYVVMVLDALRAAGVKASSLLTAQPNSSKPGTPVPPKGLEVLLDSPLPSGSKATIVQVLSSGQRWPTIKVNNEHVPWSSLQSSLRQLFLTRSEPVVLVKADGTLPFADVVDVADAGRSVGAQVVLITKGL